MFGIVDAIVSACIQSEAVSAAYRADAQRSDPNKDAIDIEATEVKPRLEIQNTTSTGCNGQ